MRAPVSEQGCECCRAQGRASSFPLGHGLGRVSAHSPGPIAPAGSDRALPPHQVTIAAELVCVIGCRGFC